MRSLEKIWETTLLGSNPTTQEIPVNMFKEAFNSGKSFVELAIEVQRNELLAEQNEILKHAFGYCKNNSRPGFLEKLCMLFGANFGR